MAITDGNVSAGTKLYARDEGQTHNAEVVEKEGATLSHLSDGREFKSPSAAGTAIMGEGVQLRAFLSVGDGGETKPEKVESSSAITPAPKPRSKRRGKQSQPAEPPASEDQPSNEVRDERPRRRTRRSSSDVRRVKGETFSGVAATTERYYGSHDKPDSDPTA